MSYLSMWPWRGPVPTVFSLTGQRCPCCWPLAGSQRTPSTPSATTGGVRPDSKRSHRVPVSPRSFRPGNPASQPNQSSYPDGQGCQHQARKPPPRSHSFSSCFKRHDQFQWHQDHSPNQRTQLFPGNEAPREMQRRPQASGHVVPKRCTTISEPGTPGSSGQQAAAGGGQLEMTKRFQPPLPGPGSWRATGGGPGRAQPAGGGLTLALLSVDSLLVPAAACPLPGHQLHPLG